MLQYRKHVITLYIRDLYNILELKLRKNKKKKKRGRDKNGRKNNFPRI